MDSTGSNKDERTFAMLAHIGPVLVNLISGGGGGWAVPLIIWLVKKEDSAFVADQAKESLNFQISVFIIAMICMVLFFTGIGACIAIPIWILLAIGSIVFGILAAIKSNEGVAYRYPLTIRLI